MNSYNFIDNKYKKWYFSIIEKAKTKQRKKTKKIYLESHHIIPECMGGKETVLLTAKEHFICHLLLCKFTIGEYKVKMFYALRAFQMKSSNQKNRYFNSKLYETIRILNSKTISEKFSGQNNPMFGTISPTKGHKWYNDGVKEYKVHPINKKENWVSGRLHISVKKFIEFKKNYKKVS